LAEHWVEPDPTSVEEGRDLLVRRYLAGFGPAAPSDVANWAGLPIAAIASRLEGMRLRRLRSETGEELVDLPRAPLPDPATPAPVRLLPTWDATLLAHARRSGILAEEHRPRIFNTKMPQSVGTFLVDGSVAGLWRWKGPRVEVEPFDALGPEVREELDREAGRLAEFAA
jgi:hypothetical protein